MIDIDQELVDDLLDALNTGNTDGGYGPPTFAYEDWNMQQVKDVNQALADWLDRYIQAALKDDGRLDSDEVLMAQFTALLRDGI